MELLLKCINDYEPSLSTCIKDKMIFCPKTNHELKLAIYDWFDNNEQAIQEYGHISNWNTKNITNMMELFLIKETFNEDISRWNTSNVTTMKGMFNGCKAFNHPLNDWDVSKVKNMRAMFFECEQFNQPLNKWMVSNVKDMCYMFNRCYTFKQDISNLKINDNTATVGYIFSQYPPPHWLEVEPFHESGLDKSKQPMYPLNLGY
jgi:surface protein